MKHEAPAHLTIDGQSHSVESFSEKVQNLIMIRTQWQNDAQAERMALSKTEAAVRALDAELAKAVTDELAERAGETDVAQAANDA